MNTHTYTHASLQDLSERSRTATKRVEALEAALAAAKDSLDICRSEDRYKQVRSRCGYRLDI